jgi:hypothetical protein
MIHFSNRSAAFKNVYINGKFEGTIKVTRLGKYVLISSFYECPNKKQKVARCWHRLIRKEAKKYYENLLGALA